MAWGSPLYQSEAIMSVAKHGKPEEPKDSPAYMLKLIGSIGLILLGGLFAGELCRPRDVDRRVAGEFVSHYIRYARSDIGVDGLG